MAIKTGDAEEQLRRLQSMAINLTIEDEPEPDFDDEEYDQEGQIQWKPEPSEPVHITVSVEQKVQVTQYEPASAFISMTITADTTEAEMEAALANGKLAWKKLTNALMEKVNRLELGEVLGRTDKEVERKRSAR